MVALATTSASASIASIAWTCAAAYTAVSAATIAIGPGWSLQHPVNADPADPRQWLLVQRKPAPHAKQRRVRTLLLGLPEWFAGSLHTCPRRMPREGFPGRPRLRTTNSPPAIATATASGSFATCATAATLCVRCLILLPLHLRPNAVCELPGLPLAASRLPASFLAAHPACQWQCHRHDGLLLVQYAHVSRAQVFWLRRLRGRGCGCAFTFVTSAPVRLRVHTSSV